MRPGWSICAAIALCLTLSACGSALTPEEKAEVLGAGGPQGSGGDGSTVAGPGADGSGAPGTGGAGSGGTGTGTGGSGSAGSGPVKCKGTGGATDKGVSVFTNTALLEEGRSNREMQLYRTWLGRVAPGAAPDYFGFFAWGAAKLFVELAAKVGPNLTRKALLDAAKGVRGYTANGLFSAQDVGGKRTAKCWAFIRLKGGRWVREAPGSGFRCGQLIDTGVGR